MSKRHFSLGRMAVVGATEVCALLFLGAVLPGLEISGWKAAVVTVVVIAVLNALVWPVLTRFALTLMVFSAGLFALLMNGVVLLAAGAIVPGFEVSSIWTAVITAIGISVVTVVVSALLALDDDASYFRSAARLAVERRVQPQVTDVPGILFLQIDGLSEPVLRRALSEGRMPTVARWVRSGSHRIVPWECDLSSQTGASQAGILLGDNHDMPAFRWYEKDTRRVMVSNHPRDAADIEARHSAADGLLTGGGVSRANVFSGGASDTLFTFSTVADRTRPNREAFRYYFSDPYSMTRLLVLGFAEVAREIRARRYARRRDVHPRLARKGVYPILRAGTTVVLREFTVATLISDIYRGVPSAYVDFVGYDEVAHHSGISAPDALADLHRLDQQLCRIEHAMSEGPRPYHVVVLSDHGQTQGATFLQRYGITLHGLVSQLLEGDATVAAPTPVGEGWGNVNGLLTDAIHDDQGVSTKLLRAAVRTRTVDGEVVLGPGYDEHVATPAATDGATDDAIVLASGNLGLISLTRLPGRATIEAIQARHPGLLAGLAAHPGIGFLMVRSEQHGAVVLGATGVRYLADDRVEGEDPLAPFGPRTADHLRRTDGFVNTPDILVNSFYDPDADEGAAFEELIGFHGGLGGKQSEPFVCFPRSFPFDEEELVGAASIHHLFKGWLTQALEGTLPAPGTAPTNEVALPDLLTDPVSVPAMTSLPTPAARAELGVTWIGHATTRLDIGGMRVLTDPLLTKRVAHLRRRRPLDAATFTGIDLVLLSHLHMDHLHLPSLRVLGKDIPLVAPAGAGDFLRRRGFANVTELSVGERTDVGPLAIRAVPAVHKWGRGPHSLLSARPVGYVIDDGTSSVYFAGDTDLFEEMHDIRGVDVALLPIWGWGSTIGEGHLDPARALTAARRLEAGVVVPIHWGTYSPIQVHSAAPAWLDRPAALFDELIASSELHDSVELLLPGASLRYRSGGVVRQQDL